MAEVHQNERPVLKEHISHYSEMRGMQGRMFLADLQYLNPDKDCPPNIELAAMGEGNVVPLEKTSRFDRRQHWKDRVAKNEIEEDYGKQFMQWRTEIIETFTDDRSRGAMEKLKPLFAAMGITVGETFSPEQATALYNHYFLRSAANDGQAKPIKGVELFIKDVLATYQTDAGKIDYENLKNNFDHIQWLGTIFGEPSTEIIVQRIAAEAKRRNSDPFFAPSNRAFTAEINNIKPNERQYELLKHLYEHGVVSDEETKLVGEETELVEEVSEEDKFLIEKARPEVHEAILDKTVEKIIIASDTGTGKTLKLWYMIHEVDPEGKMFITVPRKAVAEASAIDTAAIHDEVVGGLVGWQHGEGAQVSPESYATYAPEQSLLLKMLKDPLLLHYRYIVIDEWHERHKQTDILLAKLLDVQQARKEKGRDPLKILVASATLNKDKLLDYLGRDNSTRLIEVLGRKYPIENIFDPPETPPVNNSNEYPHRAADATEEMLNSGSHNILTFMPGEGLIFDTAEQTKKKNLPNLRVNILYGGLSAEEQKEARQVDSVVRTAIISSPVAETSFSIDNIDVISAGLMNEMSYDPSRWLSFLQEKKLPRKRLLQQRGRTGRKAPGRFRFLGTEAEYNSSDRPEEESPEITRVDLTADILFLKKLGVNLNELKFIRGEEPNPVAEATAITRLKLLDALDNEGNLTEIGEKMVRIPTDTNLQRMLVAAEKLGSLKTASLLAVLYPASKMLSVRPKDRSNAVERQKIITDRRAFDIKNSDFLSLLEIWKQFEAVPDDQKEEWAKNHSLRFDVLSKIEESRRRLLKKAGYNPNIQDVNGEEIEHAVAIGFKDMLLQKTGGGLYELVHAPEKVDLDVSRNSSMSKINYNSLPKYLVSGGNYPRQDPHDKRFHMILNQRILPEWYEELGIKEGKAPSSVA